MKINFSFEMENRHWIKVKKQLYEILKNYHFNRFIYTFKNNVTYEYAKRYISNLLNKNIKIYIETFFTIDYFYIKNKLIIYDNISYEDIDQFLEDLFYIYDNDIKNIFVKITTIKNKLQGV